MRSSRGEWPGAEGLKILITGGAVGIGAGIARLVASRGACVTVSDVNDEAEALVEEIRAADGKAIYCHADVTDDSGERPNV